MTGATGKRPGFAGGRVGRSSRLESQAPGSRGGRSPALSSVSLRPKSRPHRTGLSPSPGGGQSRRALPGPLGRTARQSRRRGLARGGDAPAARPRQPAPDGGAAAARAEIPATGCFLKKTAPGRTTSDRLPLLYQEAPWTGAPTATAPSWSATGNTCGRSPGCRPSLFTAHGYSRPSQAVRGSSQAIGSSKNPRSSDY